MDAHPNWVSTVFPVLLHSWTWRTLQLLPHLPRLPQANWSMTARNQRRRPKRAVRRILYKPANVDPSLTLVTSEGWKKTGDPRFDASIDYYVSLADKVLKRRKQ